MTRNAIAIAKPTSPPNTIAARTEDSSFRFNAAGACTRNPQTAIAAAMKPKALAAPLAIEPTGSTRRP